MPGDRARVLRRLHAHGDRRHARRAGWHHQGAHATGTEEDAGAARRGPGGHMTVDHDHWADAAGAYVLGAMPERERAQFERHLATCAACQTDVDELRPAAEALPMASPPMLPPAALKDR